MLHSTHIGVLRSILDMLDEFFDLLFCTLSFAYNLEQFDQLNISLAWLQCNIQYHRTHSSRNQLHPIF